MIGSRWPRVPARFTCWCTFVILFGVFVFGANSTSWGQSAPEGSPEAREIYQRAVALQNRELYDLAAKEWTTLVSAHAQDPLAAKGRHYRGVCYFQLGKYTEAAADFSDVLQNHPQIDVAESSYINRGLALFNLAQAQSGEPARKAFAAAIENFEAQLAKFESGDHAPSARFYLGESYYLVGDADKAIAAYEEFRKRHPKNELLPRVLYGESIALLDQSRAADAEKVCRTYLEWFADHPLASEVRVRLGDACFQQQKYEEAKSQFSQAASRPEFSLADYALLRQASAEFELGEFESAARSYTKLVDQFPKSGYQALAAMNAGKALLRAGHAPEAEKQLQLVWDKWSEPESAHWLAQSLLSQERPADAEKLVKSALSQKDEGPWAAELLLDLANALYEQPNRRADSVTAYQRVAQEFPQHEKAGWALYAAADTAWELNQDAKAKTLGQQFLKRYSTHEDQPRVSFLLAEVARREGNSAHAAQALESLTEEHEQHEDRQLWVNRLALNYLKLENPAKVLPLLSGKVTDIADVPQRLEAAATLATAHLDLDESREAQQVIEAVLQKNRAESPLQQRLQLLLSEAFQKNGQSEKAIATLNEITSKPLEQSIQVSAWRRLAEYRAQQGQHDEAAKAHRELLKLPLDDPTEASTLFELATNLEAIGQDTDAVRALERLKKNHPDDELTGAAQLLLAKLHWKLQQPEKVLEASQQFLATNPKDQARLDALYLTGLAEAALKHYDKAAGVYQEIVEAGTDYGQLDRVLYELAWAHQDAGSTDKAQLTFAKLAQQFPNSALGVEAAFRVGEAAIEAKDFEKAAVIYQKAADNEAGTKEIREKALHKLGWAHFHAQDLQQAASTFSRQLETYPQGSLKADGRFMLGESLFQQRKYPQSLENFQQVLAETSELSPAYRVVAQLHAAQAASLTKQWKLADKILTDLPPEIAEESPHRDAVAFERGWVAYNLAKHDVARPLFESIAKRNRTDLGARAQLMVGEIQMAAKEYEKAIPTFFAVAYDYGYPESPKPFHFWQAKAMFDAARCLEQMERWDNAKKVYEELVEQFPKSEEAPHARKRLEEFARAG